MTSPEMSRGPEVQPVDSFEWVIGSIKEKFVDAIFEQRDNPGFRYIGMPYRHPDIDEPLAYFWLVDTTDTGDVVDLVRHRLAVGIPVESLDIDAPISTIGDEGHESFVLFWQDNRNNERDMVVSRQTFDGQLRARNSPLQGLSTRLMQTRPFPIMQNP